MPSIELTGLVKDYTPTVRAVDHLDLRIDDAEFVALLGPSGCGKTTTLRMIAGLERPTAGQVRVGDRLLSCADTLAWVPPERRDLGLVFQNYALWPHLTVAQNAAFGLEMQGMPKPARAARVRQILELMRIDGEADRYPSQLSGGQQQRVALARMLAVDPQVLLLDEPLSNLDASLRLEMRAEIKRLHQQLRGTVVFVTHDQLEAMTMATRIVVMDRGVIQQADTPDRLYRRPANLFVAGFVGSPPMNLVPVATAPSLVQALLQTLASAGASSSDLDRIRTLGVRPEDLDVAHDRRDERDPARTIEGRVDTVLPTGPTWIVQVRVDDAEVFVVLGRAPACAPGETIHLEVRPSDIHAFGEDSQRIETLDTHPQEHAA